MASLAVPYPQNERPRPSHNWLLHTIQIPVKYFFLQWSLLWPPCSLVPPLTLSYYPEIIVIFIIALNTIQNYSSAYWQPPTGCKLLKNRISCAPLCPSDPRTVPGIFRYGVNICCMNRCSQCWVIIKLNNRLNNYTITLCAHYTVLKRNGNGCPSLLRL